MHVAQYIERRDFFRRTAAGLGAIALNRLLAQDSAADPLLVRRPHAKARAKSVIFLFMSGAPSQLDLLDPKPLMRKYHGEPMPQSMIKDLKDDLIRGSARVMASPREFQRYGKSGLEFSELLPNLGTCADKLCVIRSFRTDNANHTPAQFLMNTGSILAGRPSIGSWVLYGLGSECRDLPGYVVMLSTSQGKGVCGGAANWSNGFMPSHFRGVSFRNQGDAVLHLSNPEGVSAEMQRGRLDLIRGLNGERARITGDSEIASRVAAYELAFRMQTAAPDLLDFSRESAKTLEMYGIGKEPTHTFGSNCLLARRMVERGVRFVQMYHSSWDDHNDLHKNLNRHCAITDQPAAALIHDLERRGLLDSTLVIWGGEFGRTPMFEVRRGNTPGKEGRDHHSEAFSMMMAGAGVRGGQTLGRTDDFGYHVVDQPYHVHDLQATILHQLGLDHTRLTYPFQGRQYRLTDVHGNVIVPALA
ncbi:MAG: DUF1501 domain-containing protein [Acidobacteria bacterium]|nr:DUF1501 domain-containing protein [Acidobacteriota bacterium]